MISSFPTFIPRPIALCGLAFIRTATMRSRSPRTRPLLWGPPMPFPPLKTTREAPFARTAFRFDLGGSSAAASTIKGIPSRPAPAATSINCAIDCFPRKWTMAAVLLLIAERISAAATSVSVPTRTNFPPHASIP